MNKLKKMALRVSAFPSYLALYVQEIVEYLDLVETLDEEYGSLSNIERGSCYMVFFLLFSYSIASIVLSF